jgi:D-tyrosyl-tRNA(Tyr) deacylase
MRAVVQRVAWAEVEVEGEVVSRIEQGLLVYVGVATADTPAEAETLARKVAAMRIFRDEQDKMNLSVRDVKGEVLLVPNFTLLADARKGRRPAFSEAAPGAVARPLTDSFARALRAEGCRIGCGVFGADMTVRSAAQGPVNLIVEMPPRP